MRGGGYLVSGGLADAKLHVAQGGKFCAPGMGISDVYFMGEHAFGIVRFGKYLAARVDDHRVAVVDSGSGCGVGAAAIAHKDKRLIFDGAGEA